MPQITARLSDGLAVTLTDGRHEWLADEPIDAGGSDHGPDPYELLLSALAACTCITIAGYCRHKGLALQSVSASLSFSRVHAEDCEDCDGADKGTSEEIVSEVHIQGDFDEGQKKRLAQIATRCPVHKTLASGVRIKDHARFDDSPEAVDVR